MAMRHRVIGGLLLIVATFVLIGGDVTGVGASSTLPRDCTANGSMTAKPSPSGISTWTIGGSGTCTGDFSGNYTLTLRGSGTSNGLSQCTGDPVTLDLDLAVDVTVSNLSASKTYHQTWSLPVDNYSVRTAFVIGGDGFGAGYIGHHIFLACPGSGSPSASYAFSYLG